LDLAATERNGPFRDFVRALTGVEAAGPVRVAKADFLASCPKLYAKVACE
jgi:hypothetical protein